MNAQTDITADITADTIHTLNEELRPSLIDALAGLGRSVEFTEPHCCTLEHLLFLVAEAEDAVVSSWDDGTIIVSDGLFAGRYRMG